MHTEMLGSVIEQHFQAGNKKKTQHFTFGLIEGYLWTLRALERNLLLVRGAVNTQWNKEDMEFSNTGDVCVCVCFCVSASVISTPTYG